MTYVEFYDSATIENVCACLTTLPKRVVLMGFQNDALEEQATVIRQLFHRRNQPLECVVYTVNRYDVPSSVRAVESIIDRYGDPVFDITGGDALLVMALGIVLQRHNERRFQVHRFSVENGNVLDCDRDGVTVYKQPPMITSDETVALYKGGVMFGNVNSTLTYKWDCDDDFLADCRTLWSICHAHTGHWNKHISAFHALVESCTKSDNQTEYRLSRSEWDDMLEKAGVRYYYSDRIGTALLQSRLLTCHKIDHHSVCIGFKNLQVKRALSKAGQALELHTYLTVKSLQSSFGNPLCHDVLNGVVIDWDGKRELSDGDGTKIYDVENEVDVMAMRDMVPIFISCKNGYVDACELYKLEAVAERFGGTYAKKILVMSSRSVGGASGKALLKRAEDMGIHIIDSVDVMASEEFAQALTKIIQ